jgi:hypothetical protein
MSALIQIIISNESIVRQYISPHLLHTINISTVYKMIGLALRRNTHPLVSAAFSHRVTIQYYVGIQELY